MTRNLNTPATRSFSSSAACSDFPSFLLPRGIKATPEIQLLPTCCCCWPRHLGREGVRKTHETSPSRITHENMSPSRVPYVHSQTRGKFLVLHVQHQVKHRPIHAHSFGRTKAPYFQNVHTIRILTYIYLYTYMHTYINIYMHPYIRL